MGLSEGPSEGSFFWSKPLKAFRGVFWALSRGRFRPLREGILESIFSSEGTIGELASRASWDRPKGLRTRRAASLVLTIVLSFMLAPYPDLWARGLGPLDRGCLSSKTVKSAACGLWSAGVLPLAGGPTPWANGQMAGMSQPVQWISNSFLLFIVQTHGVYGQGQRTEHLQFEFTNVYSICAKIFHMRTERSEVSNGQGFGLGLWAMSKV